MSLNVIVPSGHTSAIVFRSEPAPLSALLVTVRAAEQATVSVSVAELLPGVGSVTPAGLLTVAVLDSVPVADPLIVALTV